ncbi:hypothetical protein HS961_11470 [Comamonas piscis]|uniref:Trypsin-like serine protease n=1 Tax=Comamonas piscis TaxID=1562974 RepID=A0A7G5EHC6_9BURK|nr:hypothetical protein [Comamonas piscis]QMV73401.1 hypothetical protein HS961_11470 [Comamonas piscis]WSO36207.1 hypothetical protein VUJ63_11505 [Comamonas piscis]
MPWIDHCLSIRGGALSGAASSLRCHPVQRAVAEGKYRTPFLQGFISLSKFKQMCRVVSLSGICCYVPGVLAAALSEHFYEEAPEAVLAYWTDEKLRAVNDKGDVPIKPPVADPLDSDGDAWERIGASPPGLGRLFFVRPNGQDASCTATVVEAASSDVIVTAMHCLHTRSEQGDDAWSDRLLFLPAFRDGAGPQGRYTIRRLVAPEGALESEQDGAFLQARASSEGAKVGDVAGQQAIRFDAPLTAGPRITFGYPVWANAYGILPPPPPYDLGNPEYSGQRLAYCATQRPVINGCKAFGSDIDREWGMPCVQGPGSSGGPAMIDFDFDTGLGTVVGTNNMGVVVDERANLCANPLDEAGREAFEYINRTSPRG